MASIKKTDTGWTARITWRESGKLKQKYKSGFRTQREAKKWSTNLETQLDRGISIAPKEVAFADYFEEWFKTYKESKLSFQTINRYKIIERVIRKCFGKRKIQKIKRVDYQYFINDFGATHAKDTVNKTNSIIKACVKSAMLDEIIFKDFTDGITIAFNKDKNVKVEYLNLTDIKSLIATTAEGRNIHFPSRYMILAAIYTGARLGELQALTWDDINTNWKTININKAWNYSQGGGFKETKNESSKRIIRVNRQLIDWLNELKANNTKMVFEGQYHTVPSSNAVNKTLRKLLKSLELNKLNFHFHSLRHSHVAYMLSQGADIYSISKRLGHADLATTTRTYAYLLDEYKAQQDDKFEKYLDLMQYRCNSNK
ncbi:tyrosine-type recombinase/integrase [Liquorilactobacillus satsumensis]|uniref:tyrosine-type recombinase/integrase n=1 Tax=Liquorilactobacillus satsumensis TaxID=259059 RepID=UPI0039EB6A5A